MASLYDQERALYARQAMQTLKATERALCMHAWGNSPREAMRLQAIRDILSERKTGGGQ